MKPHYKPLATALAATLQLALHAAVPVAWTNSPGMPPYPIKPVPHGSTVDLAVTLKGYTTPPIADGADVRLWYQTNGMGSAWWSAPATFDGSTITATFGPAQDCGADRVSLFFGAPSNVFASAVLRLTHAPGFSPSSLPLPVPALDFATVELRNLSALTNGWSFGSTSDLTDSTNYTDRALGAFAATGSVARAATYGTQTRWTDATGCVWQVTTQDSPWVQTAGTSGLYFVEWFTDSDLDYVYSYEPGWYICGTAFYPVFAGNDPHAAAVSAESSPVVSDFDSELVTFERIPAGTPYIVGRVALTNDIPPATDLSPIQQDIADLRTENAVVYRLYSGSNIVAEVTNFSSQVHAPELRLMQLNESNEYVTVWAETNGLTRTLKRANEYTDNATGAVARASAPRAWGRTTSGLGADAPSNTTWISTEKLVIASGLEYVHIDSAGVWILCANGQVDFSTPTNSFFSISTDSGENVFSVERTDSRPIPVYCDGIKVASSGDNTIVTVPVPVVDATENANEPPFLNVALDMKGPWYSETNGIPSTVVSSCSWSGQNGAWTNTIVLSASHPSAFFNYSKWQAGGTVIRNKAAMEVSGGVLCTDGIHKGRPVYNNGTIIWEVVP